MSIGTLHILAIGVADYGGLSDLTSPAADAGRIAKVLEQRFGATTHLLSGVSGAGTPDRTGILDALDGLRGHLRPDDMLVAYFGGHAVAHPVPGLLAQGALESPDSVLSWRRFTGALSELPCAQTLVILNCCFAARIAEATRRAVQLPYMRRTGRLDVICATGAEDQAPDLYPDAPGGQSPFARALCETLTDAAEAAEVLTAEALFEALSRRTAADAPAQGVRLAPVFLPDLLKTGGAGHPVALRPEPFAVSLASVSDGSQGVWSDYNLPTETGTLALDWTLEQVRSQGAEVDIESKGGGAFRLRAAYPGTYRLRAIARSGGGSVSRVVTFRVAPTRQRPPEIRQEGPMHILTGQRSVHRLPVSGGEPPFAVTSHDLPQGVTTRIETDPGPAVTLIADIAPAGGEGTPASAAAALPVLRRVHFALTDAAGHSATFDQWVPVIPARDYVCIPKGAFQSGYEPGGPQATAVGAVFDASYAKLAGSDPKLRRIPPGRLGAAQP